MEFKFVQQNKALSLSEIAYWTRVMSGLRVGTEIELDAPLSLGTIGLRNNGVAGEINECNIESHLCPCKNDDGCSKKCVLEDKCTASPWFERCAVYDEGVCPNAKEVEALSVEAFVKNNCSACAQWKFKCIGANCINFSNNCGMCGKEARSCVGCAFAKFNNIERDPQPSWPSEDIRKYIANILKPSNHVGTQSENNIVAVSKDGSLFNGGVEIVTYSLKPDYDYLTKVYTKIMEACAPFKLEVNHRCSTHFHILLSHLEHLTCSALPDNVRADHAEYRNGLGTEYNSSEVERPVPPIILANIHQLIRRYEAGLVWLTAADGNNMNSLTRWDKFRKTITPYSAETKSIERVIADISGCGGRDQLANDARWYAVQYQPIRFNSDGDITTFHFEVRLPDGCMLPKVIAAWAMIMPAIVIKAIEISAFGIISDTGSGIPTEERIRAYSRLMNNPTGGDTHGPRNSDNSKLTAADIKLLQAETAELLELIKEQLSINPEVWNLLNALNDKPIAIRRAEGESWEKINAKLKPDKLTVIPPQLLQCLFFNKITDAVTEQEWTKKASIRTSIDEVEIQTAINSLKAGGKLLWVDSLKTYIKPSSVI